MAHLQGYTGGAVGNMLNHYTRHDGDPNQERYTYGNQKIDKSRTHLNYALFERSDPKAFIRQRVALADTKPKKGANVISDWVLTAPESVRRAGREREFFEEGYRFLVAKVGQENVVGAWVHMDETSPHMHFCFVPLCEQTVMTNDKSRPLRWTERDEAKNPAHKAGEVKRDSKGTVRYRRVVATGEDGQPIVKKTVSQSKMFDRRAMRDFHPQLEAHMERHFGFKVGIQLEDEGDKLLSKLGHGEYVAAKSTLRKTKAEVGRIEDKREEIRRLASEESGRLERLQRARGSAQERVGILEAVAAECRAAGGAPVSRRGALFDRIAALCARLTERLGVAARGAKGGAQKRLGIGVRHSPGAGRGLGRRKHGTGVGLAGPTPVRQAQKEYTM